MDNVKEKNEAYSLVHDTHSPTRTATATAGPQFTSFSSGSYDVPNIGSLPSTSKGFPVDVRYNLPWNLHSQSVENNRVGDASVFHSVNPNQYQSYESQNVLKESFDIPVIDLTREHTDRYKLDEDQTLTSSERDPHHGQNTPQVKPTCNSTSDEPLGLGQNDVTTMFMWSSETKRPLSTTFLHRPPQSPLFHPSATMITSYREIPRSYLEAQGNRMNTPSPSLFHPSNTQFVQADSALNTPTHFSSPENETDNVSSVEYQRNISPFGILQSSYVNTDEVKKDGGLPGTVADDPTRVTSISQIVTREECDKMQRMNNGEERNYAYSPAVYPHFSSNAAPATTDSQFTNTLSESYNILNMGAIPSTSNGFSTNVEYNLPWNLHSESVENNHSASGRPGDVSAFHSINPIQYQSSKPQHEFKETFYVPRMDLDQENTDRNRLDEDQNLRSSERDPHQDQNMQQATPICNSTSGESLGQNAFTRMFMWSSQTHRPISTTPLLEPQPSPHFHPSATMIASSREIPRTGLEAQGNSMNIESPSLSHPSNTQFVQADSALNTPTHFSSPEKEADNISSVEDQGNISPFGILQSSYVNTDEVKKDGGLPGTVDDDPARVTSISQILTREEKEADNVSSVEDQENISPFGIFQSSYVNTEEVKKDDGPTVTIADYPSRKTSVRQELNSGECDKTQRINNGEDKNDTYPPEFYTDSSSFAVTPVSETQFTNSSSESYNIPNIASVPSTSRGFPGDGEYNLPWNLHSESVDNDHSKSDRPDISVFRSLNPKQYQSNKLQRELKKSFHVPVIDLDQENTDINKLDEDQNLKSLERCPHQSQNIQQVTPSNTTSNGSLGLNHNALTPTLIRSSQAQFPLSTTSLNQSSPSSFFDSAPPLITSSKEIPVTSQGAERSSTNIQSHSPSHPSEPQLVPTETSPGKEVESASAAEDQVNTSPSRNSQSSDANSDEISKKDGGLSVPTVDDVPSRERSTKQNLNKKDVLEPIQTKILKYKDGRKRMFMVLHRSSFESMKDKGLIQPVKAFPDGHMLPVTRDEIESSKTLLPPTHQQEDIDKIQYKSITQLEDLETEMPDSLEDIRKLPMPGSCEPASPLQAFERPFSPFEIEWSASSFPGSGEPRGFVPTANQTPIVVTWSATSVTDSPALTFTIRLPSKMNASPFTLHSASVIPPGASNQSASTPKTMIRPKLSTETPHTSLWPPASFSNQAPSSAAQDPSQMHDMSPAKELDQDANHDVPKEPKVVNISNNRGSKNQKPVRKNIFWLANKQGHSELMEEEVKQLAENARNHYKNFEETKLEMKKRYNRLLNKHSQRYNGLLKKYKNLERTCSVTKDAGSREQIIRDAKKFLSEDHAMFLESQMFLKNRAGKGNRFSKKFLKYVIGIYEQSPAGYKFLRTIFTLPSIRTIHKWQSRSYQNVEENLVDQDLTEMTGTYGDIESFADMLQMEPLPSSHEQTEMNNTESFQELTSVPPTDFYESNGALFWEGSQVCFEVPHDIAVPQEQPVQRGCEVEYIQTAEDMYMLSQ